MILVDDFLEHHKIAWRMDPPHEGAFCRASRKLGRMWAALHHAGNDRTSCAITWKDHERIHVDNALIRLYLTDAFLYGFDLR